MQHCFLNQLWDCKHHYKSSKTKSRPEAMTLTMPSFSVEPRSPEAGNKFYSTKSCELLLRV